MAGKLDEISFRLGGLEESIETIKGRAEEDRALHRSMHAENQKAISDLRAALTTNAAVSALTPKQRNTLIASATLLIGVVLWLLNHALAALFSLAVTHLPFLKS